MKELSNDRTGPFVKSQPYTGWAHSIYEAEWFDSSTERDVANILDAESMIAWWVKLRVGDLAILWRSDGREYNADFVAIDTDDIHWVIEVKMDKEATTDEVQEKRTAAQRWVNHVNADPSVPNTWRYILVTETYVKDAKGSWLVLSRLGA